MESKAYFEKVMQDFNQFRNGRSLRKYCTDEGIDYNWLIKYKKDYSGKRDRLRMACKGILNRCWTLAVGQYSTGKDVCFLWITQGKRVAS